MKLSRMNCAFGAALLGIALFSLPAAPRVQVTSAKSSKSKSSKPASVKYGATHRKVAARSRRSAPSYQLHPDPERYQQIQQALAERGYFKGQINGQWGDDSVEALKRFQFDQKLVDDGKISALTLTGLGLGPTHNGSPVTPPAPASSDPATAAHADSPENPAPPPPGSSSPTAPAASPTTSTPPR